MEQAVARRAARLLRPQNGAVRQDQFTQQIEVVRVGLVRDVHGAAADGAARRMVRAHRVAGLEHIPVGVDELAEPGADLRVDVQMQAVRFGLVGPEVGRGARQRWS